MILSRVMSSMTLMRGAMFLTRAGEKAVRLLQVQAAWATLSGTGTASAAETPSADPEPRNRAAERRRRGLNGSGQSRPHALSVMLTAYASFGFNAMKLQEKDMTENNYISRAVRDNMGATRLLKRAAEALTRDADLGLVAGSHAIQVLGAMTRLGYTPKGPFTLAMAGAVDQDLTRLRPMWVTLYGQQQAGPHTPIIPLSYPPLYPSHTNPRIMPLIPS